MVYYEQILNRKIKSHQTIIGVCCLPSYMSDKQMNDYSRMIFKWGKMVVPKMTWAFKKSTVERELKWLHSSFIHWKSFMSCIVFDKCKCFYYTNRNMFTVLLLIAYYECVLKWMKGWIRSLHKIEHMSFTIIILKECCGNTELSKFDKYLCLS